LNSILVSSNINSGFTYKLKYRAHNVQGWSGFSPEVSIIAATIPGVIDEPQTIIEGTDVKLSWQLPDNTGGAAVAITNYLVEVKLSDESFSTACETADLYCSLAMSLFEVEPYLFV
jgi:hypothetical protein